MIRPLLRLAPFVLAIAICAASVQAGDEIGIFFDSQGLENCVRLDQFGITEAYLLLLGPTAFGGVAGWECSVEVDDVALLEVSLIGLAIDIDPGQTDFQVGLGVPLYGPDVVHVATLRVMLTGQQTAFYLYPNQNNPSLDDSPVYVGGADPTVLVPLTPHTITGENMVAGINAYQCFPESKTWAELKIIYR